MIYASRGAPRDVPPLELDGIRYQQLEDGLDVNLPERCGYLQAIDMQSGNSLWIVEVYSTAQGRDSESHVIDCYFLRMKFRLGTRDILIENEMRNKYLVNIDTQQVRKATPADFPSSVKRAPPPIVPPIEYQGMRYEQIMNGHDAGRPERCGYLDGIDIKTNAGLWVRQIYSVPFNDEIEDDTQECYFTRMVLLPGQQDLLIENEVGDKYLFNLKRRDTRPLSTAESDYLPASVSVGARINDSLKGFFQRSKK